MKQRLVVDTFSFVQYFRDAKDSIIPYLAMEDAILLSKVVRLELLKGSSRRERKLLLNFLEGLFSLDDFPSADLVETILLRLHGRGMSLGFADLLILADSLRMRAGLLTADKALAKAAAALGVNVSS